MILICNTRHKNKNIALFEANWKRISAKVRRSESIGEGESTQSDHQGCDNLPPQFGAGSGRVRLAGLRSTLIGLV